MYDSAEPSFAEIKSFTPPGACINAAARRPVFLHGLWRSGSTFLWSRFRAAPGTCCFYEPLHHGLAKLTPARVARDTPERVSANHHPEMAEPYFSEFAPLIQTRGVQGYHPSLAYDRYILEPQEDHPRLERYVRGLIEHAGAQGRTAVLGFNRTGLRIGWLRAHFHACNIHIDREPAAVWASYAAEMANGNYAFFSMWLLIVEKNAAHPLFAPLAERLGLRAHPVSLASPKTRHRRIMQAMSPEESYFLVYYLWLACTAHAVAECDLLIDTRRAGGGNLHYAREVAAGVARLTGVRINLDDIQAPAPRTALSRVMQGSIEQSAAAIFPRQALPGPAVFERRRRAFSTLNADRLAAAF